MGLGVVGRTLFEEALFFFSFSKEGGGGFLLKGFGGGIISLNICGWRYHE